MPCIQTESDNFNTGKTSITKNYAHRTIESVHNTININDIKRLPKNPRELLFSNRSVPIPVSTPAAIRLLGQVVKLNHALKFKQTST